MSFGGRGRGGGGGGGRGGGGGGDRGPAAAPGVSAAPSASGGKGGQAGGGGGDLEEGELRFLTVAHKRALATFIKSPIDNPRREFSGIDPTYVPAVQDILCFELPNILGPTATSFGAISHMEPGNAFFRHLLMMLSACVTNPNLGTPSTIDAGEVQQPGPGGAPPAGAPGASVPAGGLGRGGGGGGGGWMDISRGSRDIRGRVEAEGLNLKFTYRGNQYDRVVPYVEELCDGDGAPTGHRIWIFVYDRSFNFGEGLQQIIDQNRAFYNTDVEHPLEVDSYISHSFIQSAPLLATHVINPFLRHCIHAAMPEGVRQHVNTLLDTLADKSRSGTMASNFGHPEHILNPRTIFNKMMLFASCDRKVCADQRDPRKYFNIDRFYMGETVAQAAAAADRGEEEDPDLIAPEGPADAMGDDLDEELAALNTTLGERTTILGRGVDAADRYYQEEEQARVVAPDATTLLLNDRDAQALRMTPDDQFLAFPIPERVWRIGSNNFGRRLLRLPLPKLMRHLDAPLGPDFHETFTASSENDTLERVSGMSISERRSELDKIYADIGERDRPLINPTALEQPRMYLDVLLEARALRANKMGELAAQNATEEIQRWLEDDAQANYETIDMGDKLTENYRYGGLLPENIRGNISTAELRDFMRHYPLLKLRFKNARDRARLEATHDVEKNPEAYHAAIMDFRKRKAKEMWDTLMTDPTLPESDREMRNFFTRQARSEQWGNHAHLIKNLSSYANMKLKMLSRYTDTFRGSVNHHLYMLSTLVYHNCFYYAWGLRLHLLAVGKAMLGKSHVYECLEVQAPDGSLKVIGHKTMRAGLGDEVYVGQTICHHEASLDLVGVDKFGRQVLADPVFKDQLTRCRTVTHRYATDKDGTTITRVYNAMHMTNTLVATNEVIPSEDSPLMTRFMVVVVNNMKRPDFNTADNNMPLGDLITGASDMVEIHHSALFSYYIYLTCKMIMCGIIEEPGMDTAEILVKDVLANFTKRTKIPTGQTRTREKLMLLIKTATIEKAVHTALFSPLAMHLRETFDKESGKWLVSTFDPTLIVTEVMKYMYATDEIVVDMLTLVAPFWEFEHRFTICDAITRVSRRPSPHIVSDFFGSEQPYFRLIHNPNYVPTGHGHGMEGAGGGGGGGGEAGARTSFSQRGQPKANMGALARQQQSSEKKKGEDAMDLDDEEKPAGEEAEDDDDDDEEDIDTVNPLIKDYRRVGFTISKLSDAYQVIVQLIPQNTPSENEVNRTLRDLSSVYYDAHPATIDLLPSVDPKKVPGSAKKKKQRVDDSRDDGASRGGADAESGTDDLALAGMKQRVDAAVKRTEKEELLAQKARIAKLKGAAKFKASKNRHQLLHWRLMTDEPTTQEPVIIMEAHPFKRNEMQVSVLIEFLIDDRHKDAMSKSIIEVLSTRIIPEGGRDFITSLPYAHKTARGETEMMPQFLRVLHVPRNPGKKYTHVFTQMSTPDARNFSQAFYGSQHSLRRTNDYGFGAKLEAKFGFDLDEEYTLNAYAAARHWLRCGYSPSDPGWVETMPAVVDNACLRLSMAIGKIKGHIVTFTEKYPEDSVRDYIRMRHFDPALLKGEHRSPFIHDDMPTLMGQVYKVKQADGTYGEFVEVREQAKKAEDTVLGRYKSLQIIAPVLETAMRTQSVHESRQHKKELLAKFDSYCDVPLEAAQPPPRMRQVQRRRVEREDEEEEAVEDRMDLDEPFDPEGDDVPSLTAPPPLPSPAVVEDILSRPIFEPPTTPAPTLAPQLAGLQALMRQKKQKRDERPDLQHVDTDAERAKKVQRQEQGRDVSGLVD